MFFPEGQIRVYLYGQPADMRCSFDGLQALTRHAMGQDPLNGSLYVFVNRRGAQVRVLYFDRSGFAMWQKRLEVDKFPWPKKHTELVVQLTPEQFSWLLDGYDVWKIKPFSELYFEKVS